MTFTKKTFLFSALAVTAFLAYPVASQAGDYNCDEHAAHIDHEIGVEKALDAYHVLHGDKEDDHHIIDELKKTHPDVEHELEEYVEKGCSDKELEAHAHDDH